MEKIKIENEMLTKDLSVESIIFKNELVN